MTPQRCMEPTAERAGRSRWWWHNRRGPLREKIILEN